MTTPGRSSLSSSTRVTSSRERPRRIRTGRMESGGTRSSPSSSSRRGILRSTESLARTVPRSSISRGMSESVKAGRLSTRARPLRSKRMPRGAATGRMRIRFLSESSWSLPPSRTWRYQSWPRRPTKATATTAARARTRRRQASRLAADSWFRSMGSDPWLPPAQRVSRLDGEEEGRGHEPVVERLGQDDVEQEIAERRREVEELQQSKAQQPFRDGQEQHPGNLHERMIDPDAAGQMTHGEAREGKRGRLNSDETAPRGVLEEPEREAHEAGRLGSASESQEGRQDEGQVRGDADHGEGGNHARLREGTPEGHEQERESHRLAARREEARHVMGGLAGEHQHFLDAGEVDHGDEHGEMEEGRALVLDGGDASDGDALGEERAQSRGHDEIPRGYPRAVARHELEAQTSARLALHETGGAGALNDGPDRRGRIVQELDDGSPGSHLHDASHEAVGEDYGHLLRDPVSATPIGGERARPAAASRPDDLSAQSRQGQAVAERGEPPEATVLLIGLPRLEGLDAETLVLRVQGEILGPHPLPVGIRVPDGEGAAVGLGQE